MTEASVTFGAITFTRSEHSYGADDPYRYKCRIGDAPDDYRAVRTTSVYTGHGKTPSAALDAAIMPVLERLHERLKEEDA